MKKILSALLVLSSLSGCALFSKEKLSAKPLVSCANTNQAIADACNAAVDAVEKANILVATINTSVDNQFNAKLMAKAQALSYRSRTKQADVQLDSATKAIQSFNFSSALTQANATKLLLETLPK